MHWLPTTGTKTTFAGSVNTYDVLNADKLIISVRCV